MRRNAMLFLSACVISSKQLESSPKAHTSSRYAHSDGDPVPDKQSIRALRTGRAMTFRQAWQY
jgi:hypothetical protein